MQSEGCRESPGLTSAVDVGVVTGGEAAMVGEGFPKVKIDEKTPRLAKEECFDSAA